MALTQIDFDNNIDASLCVGDFAYYCTVSADGVAQQLPQLIGPITEIGATYIIVDTPSASLLVPGLFILFSKPIQVEESSLKGYYANVTFENTSKTYAELFSIGSETAISSK